MKTIYANKAPTMAMRPRCPGCGKPLRPYFTMIEEHRRGAVSEWTAKVEWQGRYHSYGEFCTLRCTERFANAAVKHPKVRVALLNARLIK